MQSKNSQTVWLAIAALLAVMSCGVAKAQENRDAVDNAVEGAEVQQEIHPMLRLEGPYKATWESIDSHATPQWFLDAKIGLSMHWGPYAVPAWAAKGSGIGPDSYSEWYMNRLNTAGTVTERYHRQTYGDDYAYDNFIPQFTAENFDADEWMRRLAENGVKYFFITSKHHDGFCLWDTKYTNRNSVQMGPKRDVLRELVDAARKHGIKIGFYYSFYEWYNPIYVREFHGSGWMGDRETMLKRIEGKTYTGLIEHESYVDDFMIPQIVELIEEFQPDYLCFDGEWDYDESYWKGKQIAAYYYNQAAKRGQEVVLNDRFGKGTRGNRGDLYHVEYSANVDRSKPWAMWRGFGKSFGHNLNEDPAAFLTPKQTIELLVDCVASNGNIEFNVGPTKDGRIDQPEWSLIQHMGNWLREYGEAIYGAEADPLDSFAQGRATHKPDEHTLYLHVADWPEDGVVKLSGVANKIASARLLGPDGGSVAAERVSDSLVELHGPKHAADPFVSVLAVKYEGELEVIVHWDVQSANESGVIELPARVARLTGSALRIEEANDALGFWTEKSDHPTWRFVAPRKGKYEIVVDVALPPQSAGAAYAIEIDGAEAVRAKTVSTGNWRAFQEKSLGEVTLDAGEHELSVMKLEAPRALMNLRGVHLRPIGG